MLKLFKRAKSMRFLVGTDGRERVASFDGKLSVLEAALGEGIEIPHSCGGMGTCGTCRVFVLEAPEGLEPRNEVEQEMADERGFHEDERQACQLAANQGLKVRIP